MCNLPAYSVLLGWLDCDAGSVFFFNVHDDAGVGTQCFFRCVVVVIVVVHCDVV
jgi:hypothetical protein